MIKILLILIWPGICFGQIDINKLDYSPAVKRQVVGGDSNHEVADSMSGSSPNSTPSSTPSAADIEKLKEFSQSNPELLKQLKKQLKQVQNAQGKGNIPQDLEGQFNTVIQSLSGAGGSLKNIDQQQMMKVLKALKNEEAPDALKSKMTNMQGAAGLLLMQFKGKSSLQVERDLISHPKPQIAGFMKRSPKSRNFIARLLVDEQQAFTKMMGLLGNKKKMKLYTISVVTLFLFIFAYNSFFAKNHSLGARLRRKIITMFVLSFGNVLVAAWTFRTELTPMWRVFKSSYFN